MKKLNSSDFQEIKGVKDNKNDINLNLWDLDGSSFLLDKNINDLESTATFNNTVLNCNNYSNKNIISSKNSNDILFPLNKIPKNKNKSVNTSFVKYNNFPSERKDLKNNNNPKNNVNKKHYNKFKNNSFYHNDKYNDIMLKDLNKKKTKKSDEYNNKIKKAKQRLNHSVDYSRKDEPEISLLGNNKYKYTKKQNLNKSLSIETLNNKFKNNPKSPYNNISNIGKNKNIILNNFNNNNKHLKKSNSIDCNIYVNKNKNIKTKSCNVNTNATNDNNNIQTKKSKKLKEKENDIKKYKNKSVSKKSIEDAEKYTHYLAKKKIFSHDYELQNKLKKEQEERQVEKEMSQCTFKPQLYHNKYNNRIQSQKNNNKSKTIYEKQSQWLNNLKKKKENEREKKINKEIQGCTFIPQLTTLPKYDSKKIKITNREQIGEENYYNKMKKARQIIQEKNKGDELIERYDERRKKNILPRSMLTFGNFNQENNNIINEGSINKNTTNFNNINNNNYNWKINSFSMNTSSLDGNNYVKDYGNNSNIINDNILNFNINDKNNENNKVIGPNGKINNNYIYNNNISNNYIGLNNNNIFNNSINNNFIIDNNNNNNINNNININKIPNNFNNNSYIIQNQNSINMKNKKKDNNTMNPNKNYIIYLNNNNNKLGETQKINNNKNFDILSNKNNNAIVNYGNFINESSNKKHNNMNKRNNSNNKNINSNNKYINQRDNNNYDFDNNFIEEKYINKIPHNNFINPTIYNEEQEKENMNISTGTVTKANSIVSLQKKSSHSLPDRPEFENRFINLNNYKINKTQEAIQTNKNNNNNFNNSQDEEFNRQKMLLMNELHNWNNFDEESNEDE